MEKQLCNNCKKELNGYYCSNCGQSATLNKRLNLDQIVKDFFDNTFNLHKGFFFTFWKLIISPASVFNEYINGSRKKYTNPTRYLVIALAVLALGQYWAEANDAINNEHFEGFTFLPQQLNESMRLWDLRLITQWTLLGNLFEALVFPIGFYGLFRKLKYNYAELLVLSFYLVANSIFITICLVAIPKLVMNIYAPVLFVVSAIMLYYIYALLHFFKAAPIVKRLLFVILGLVIFFFIRFFIIPLFLALIFPLATN